MKCLFPIEKQVLYCLQSISLPLMLKNPQFSSTPTGLSSRSKAESPIDTTLLRHPNRGRISLVRNKLVATAIKDPPMTSADKA